MRVIFQKDYQGKTVVVGEVARTAYAGRSAFRQWSYRVLVNEEDISEQVVVLGMKPSQLLEAAQRLLDQQQRPSAA